MAEAIQTSIFSFNRGYATDLAPMVRSLDFLVRAENLIYDVSGSAHKVGGSTKINSVAITSGPDVVGMFDFWYSGGGSSPTQKYVAVTGNGKVYKDDMDGTFDDITGGATISNNTIPVFCQARDLLTIWFSTNDTPLKWNQSGNVASLGGTPPTCRGAVFHVNRLWAFGRNSFPSRLYYSSSTDVEDWSGADTGSIDLEPEDGDRIVGAVSYKQNLIVFKGPNIGSIHVITGSSPSTFARTVFVRNIALQTHNSIVPVGDDIWFMSDQGCHSLQATQEFGSYAGAFLTRFLRGHFRDNMNRTNLSKIWGVNYTDKGCALWVYTASGASENGNTLGLSYIRLQEDGIKPFIWTRGGISTAIRINPSNQLKEVVFGSTDGFCSRQDVANRTIDGSTAYNFRLTTPQLILGANDRDGRQRGDQPVNLHDFYMRVKPRGNNNLTVTVTRDNETSQSYTATQSPSGAVWDTDVYGTGIYGGGTLQTIYPSDTGLSGQCRAVEIDIQQGGNNEDAEIFELGITHTPTAPSRAGTV